MVLEKIIAVIVLYKSTLEESSTFQSLLRNVAVSSSNLTLVVYNNSPDYWTYDFNIYKGLNIININDDLNSGVSTAYNVGFKYAKLNNKEYIVLLDQDTELPVSYFDSFFKIEQKYKAKNLGLFAPKIVNINGLVSPAKFFLHTTKKIDEILEGENPLEGLAVINSGLIISKGLFELTGGYNDKIKLDFSDFYFLRKVLKFEKNIIIFNAECKHSLSSEENVSLKSALTRFDYYLEGAKYFRNSFSDVKGLSLWIVLRSIKLGLKYKTVKFTTKVLFS